MNDQPMTTAERVSKSQAKALEEGAVRVQAIIRDKDAVRALKRLTKTYGSRVAAITEALKSHR